MSDGLSSVKIQDVFPDLLVGVQLMEGRLSPNDLASHVVRAAMAQPGVAGARLWRVDNGTAKVWAARGDLPPAAAPGLADNTGIALEGPDPTLWTSALGSDDFQVRALEVRGAQPLTAAVRCQLEYLARFAAVVLALAERRGAMEELSCIVEATKRLNSTLDLGELIHIILQIATRQTGAERGTVFLVDKEREEIWSLVGLGLAQHAIRLPITKGIAGWVAREGLPVRLENAYDDARFEPEVDKRLGFRTERLLCLPIRNEDGSIVGVLQLLNKKESFTAADEAFIDTLSIHVAIALEKAQLHAERVEKEKLERDLELAREIQAGFLPEAPPEFPGIAIAVSHRASQRVGGDYYDFLSVPAAPANAHPRRRAGDITPAAEKSAGAPANENNLLVVVADVEGKGAASALVMANVQATLHALADRVEPLEKLPSTINQILLEGGRASAAAGRHTKYLSMFMGLLEHGGRKLRYVNAGHVPPALIRADGAIEYLEQGGMIVGLFPGVEYECGTVELRPGDVLVACTDGITEAMDAAGNEFGKPELAASVAAKRTCAPQEILRQVIAEVEKHSKGGIYEDDRILLVMKVE
ncbi:MAG TPA: PP2C family protein-serine/threonine phosphatase [Candidatus Acidoferrum sp.]|nr:PP2C family protein-serine/threonine phosphatase [Candidatus Acidoferrum sp.]